VIPPVIGPERKESLVIGIPSAGRAGSTRQATTVALDPDHDLALLRIGGPPLPALALAPAGGIDEGQPIAFVGFPIGTVLGLFPAVHRGIVSAISPIVLPQGTSQQLDQRVLRRLRGEPFPVYQLDATAYPGNSGSPLIDPVNGTVVGIVNMTFVKESRENALSQPSGISFAIPVEHLRELIRSAPPQR
jgi:S1-C subfamily serine protease